MLKRAHILISGFVQGVFFRAWILREAQDKQLTGWVKNLPDGRVEAIFEPSTLRKVFDREAQTESAQGSGQEGRKKVEEMVKKCWQGPAGAQVEKVKVTWEKATGEFSGFEIKY